MPAVRAPLLKTVQDTSVLNFAIVGQVRSGSAVVQSALNNVRDVTCHNDLFHRSPEIRQQVHERYFGPAPSKDLPTWYMPDLMNPYQYLSRQIFDQNLQKEVAIGVRLTYEQVQHFQFYDLLHDRCMEGDFCLVHVRRNPVACFASLQQARDSGIYAADFHTKNLPPQPSAVALNPQELTTFVRLHEAIVGRLAQACDDVLEISYRELVRNYSNTMKKILDFLERSTLHVPNPDYRRLPNLDMSRRIANLDELRRQVPADIREFLAEGTLY